MCVNLSYLFLCHTKFAAQLGHWQVGINASHVQVGPQSHLAQRLWRMGCHARKHYYLTLVAWISPGVVWMFCTVDECRWEHLVHVLRVCTVLLVCTLTLHVLCNLESGCCGATLLNVTISLFRHFAGAYCLHRFPFCVVCDSAAEPLWKHTLPHLDTQSCHCLVLLSIKSLTRLLANIAL